MPIKHYPLLCLTLGFCLACTTTLADTKSDVMLQSTSQPPATSKAMKNSNVEKPRGQLLYETHCGACHTTSVHGRDPRKAKSISDIKKWVTRWSTELKLNWPAADIDAVANHVNSKYYHYDN